MENNKVVLSNGDVVMDITDTTAEEADVAAGKVFYNAAGVRSNGTGNYMNKVPSATQYNVAIFDDNGQVVDAGISMADRATMRGWNDSSGFGSFIEQAQGTANMKSFGFMNTTDPDILYFETSADGASVSKHIPTKKYVDDAIAKEATETTYGTIKLNPSQSITLDANGHLVVGGRMGQFPGTTGLFAPNDREPLSVGNYSLLMTDAKGVNMEANRAMAVVSGLGLACKSAAAGTTEYRVNNTYANRIQAKMCEGGYIARDEATSTQQKIVKVLSVTINGSAFTPDSSADGGEIIITTEETLNPDAAITNIRLFGTMKSYATLHVGNGIASLGGGRNLLLGGGVTKAGSSNDNCLVGNAIYSSGNGNACFGRWHIAAKNRGFFAGSGHDSTNAPSEGASAVGVYSLLSSNTLFAVGNGSSATARSNAFEVTSDGGIVLKSPNGTRYKISVSDSGAITATAI